MRQLAGAPTPTSLRRCQHHLHNGRKAAPHGILYDIPALDARGGFYCRIPVPVCIRALLLALCGIILHSVFVFHLAPGGASPRGVCGENRKKGGKAHGHGFCGNACWTDLGNSFMETVPQNFHGFYRDVFWGILGEIFGAIVTGYFIAKFIFWALGGIAAAVWAILEPILGIALVISSIYLFAMYVWLLFQMIKKKRAGRTPAGGEPAEEAPAEGESTEEAPAGDESAEGAPAEEEYTGIAGAFWKTWCFIKGKGVTAVLISIAIAMMSLLAVYFMLGGT